MLLSASGPPWLLFHRVWLSPVASPPPRSWPRTFAKTSSRPPTENQHGARTRLRKASLSGDPALRTPTLRPSPNHQLLLISLLKSLSAWLRVAVHAATVVVDPWATLPFGLTWTALVPTLADTAVFVLSRSPTTIKRIEHDGVAQENRELVLYNLLPSLLSPMPE